MLQRARSTITWSAAATFAFATVVNAQAATPAAAPWVAPAIGAQAPDFELAGATRYGLLRSPIRLADFRDKTVVLAFFAQARTKG